MNLSFPPPLWRESLVGFEAASLLGSDVWRGAGVARGQNDPVLLVPGFLAGDGSLGLMTRWLRAQGYRTRKAGIRANVDCSAAVTDAIERRLEEMAETAQRRVAIIGQSRGGIIARSLAVRRPDLVNGIVTLGSPCCNMLRVHPLVAVQIGLVGALGTLRVPHLFTMKCLRGECCESFRSTLCADVPGDVQYVSVYSKRDGIVDWKACLDEAADCIEVGSSHCGMSMHPDVYRIVGDSLASFRDRTPVADIHWARAA